ncbi:2-hydroxyacid dehydrogenase [Acuticoccus kandeliae]|uniref:2-hydroxyacid dehydrogenase n=1 Tax=Acuticoccus kandeliae TaxID=2073160 RepID=UPI000D3EDA96|nr:2-hydroxyacid dehydrogenase [Acuticoccus kandeliae]
MKVVLYGGTGLSFRERLAARLSPDFTLVSADFGASPATRAAFDGAEAVVTAQFNRTTPASAALRLIQTTGVGYDGIDIAAVPGRATLCNVTGHGEGVAEYVILSMLQACHRFCEANASFKRGSWARSNKLGAAPHRELAGSVVGIVGYGLIGRSIATRLAPFGVTTIAANRSPIEDDPNLAETFTLKDVAAMAAKVDFLVVAVALTDQTRGLINRAVLSGMKRRAVVVNVARGPVVEEAALFEALRTRTIGGAVIDVWYNYPKNVDDENAPPSAYDFAAFTNVYMTPHISGWTEGTLDRRTEMIADNLERLASGRPLTHVVRPALVTS